VVPRDTPKMRAIPRRLDSYWYGPQDFLLVLLPVSDGRFQHLANTAVLAAVLLLAAGIATILDDVLTFARPAFIFY
jgi:hypothetical protein